MQLGLNTSENANFGCQHPATQRKGPHQKAPHRPKRVSPKKTPLFEYSWRPNLDGLDFGIFEIPKNPPKMPKMTPRRPKRPKTCFFTKSLPNRSEKQIPPKFCYRTAAKSKIRSKRDSRPCFVEKTTLRRATFATEHGKYAEFDFCAYFSCSVAKVNPKVRHESAKIALLLVFYSVFRMSKIGNVPKHGKEESFARNWSQDAIRSIKTEVWRTHVRQTATRSQKKTSKGFKCERAGGSRIKPRET